MKPFKAKKRKYTARDLSERWNANFWDIEWTNIIPELAKLSRERK